MQKTQNGSGWQAVADLHFKNSAIYEKLLGKSKQGFSKNFLSILTVGPRR